MRHAVVLTAAVLGAVVLALASAFPLSAQAVDLAVERRASLRSASADALMAHVSFRWDRMEELVSSLRAGMESRITFTLRLYEHRRGLLPFRRDRLLVQKKAERSAFWDFLDDTFVVESEDGTRESFASAEDLLRGFLTLSELSLSDVPRASSPGYYVSARALFEPVRLMPPLTLVGLVGRAATTTTPWVSREAP
ncbi:MAG: hypothetical protein ABSG63_00655 [Spirochaetia bacterium]